MSLIKTISLVFKTDASKAAADAEKLAKSTEHAAQAQGKLNQQAQEHPFWGKPGGRSGKGGKGPIGQSADEMDGLAGKTGKAGAALSSMADKATLAIGAVTAVAVAFDKVSDRSLKVQAAQSALTISIDGASHAAMGLVGDLELMQAANQATRLGVVKTSDEFARLTAIATKLSLSTGQDATKGVEDFTTALARSSPQILDNLGLQVDLDKANAEYAATLGKVASQLTEAERKQAFINAALAEGEKAAGQFNLKVDESALAIQQWKTDLINFADTAAVQFTGFLAEASEGLNQLLSDFQRWDNEWGDKVTNRRGLPGAGPGDIGWEARDAAKVRADRKAAFDEAAAINQKAIADQRVLNELFKINADATDKMTEATKRNNRARSRKEEDFLGGSTTVVETAATQDRNAFMAQLGDAQMARAGKESKAAQEQAELEERKRISEEANAFFDDASRKEIERAKAEAAAIKLSEEQKRLEMEKTARLHAQVMGVSESIMRDNVATASIAADAFIKSERRREKAKKGLMGSEAIGIGILETVKAAAAFASFNYAEGALHVAASVLAFARGGQLLAEAGGAGGGGGGASQSGFASGSAFGPGTDSGGGVQSTSGGSGRPSSNGPVSEAEESVQRSGRGGRPGPTRQRDAQPAPQINVMYMGAPDAAFGDFVRKSIKTSERKSGKVTS